MSIQFQPRDFARPQRLQTIVLVNTDHAGKRWKLSLRQRKAAGIIARCRAVLANARALGLPVVFIHGSTGAKSAKWIKGLAPERNDRVLARSDDSCFSNRYVWEVLDRSEDAVIAGFIGDGGCFGAAMDAARQGQPLCFLDDAIDDDTGTQLLARIPAHVARPRNIRALRAHSWIAEDHCLSEENRT
jgi:hypothetical protein